MEHDVRTNYKDKLVGGAHAFAPQAALTTSKTKKELRQERRTMLASMDPRARDQYMVHKQQLQREKAIAAQTNPDSMPTSTSKKEKPTKAISLSDVLAAQEHKKQKADERRSREECERIKRPQQHNKPKAHGKTSTAMVAAVNGQLAHGRRGKEKVERGALHFSKIKRTILAERSEMFKKFYELCEGESLRDDAQVHSDPAADVDCEQTPKRLLDEHRALMSEMLVILNRFHECAKSDVSGRKQLLNEFRKLKKRGSKQDYCDLAAHALESAVPTQPRECATPFLVCFENVDPSLAFVKLLADGNRSAKPEFIDDVETTKIVNALTFFPPTTAFGLGVHTRNPRIDLRSKSIAAIARGTHTPIRNYVHHNLTDGIDDAASQLLTDLHRMQRKLKQTQPLRFKALQRYVAGLRETFRSVRLGRAKLCIVTPDVEAIAAEGGTDDQIASIVSLCAEQRTPVVFALGRQRLGQLLWNRTGSSAVAILSAEGAHDKLRCLVAASAEACEAYAQE